MGRAQHQRDADAFVLRLWTRYRIGRRLQDGWSLSKLAADLDEKGEPTPRGSRWHKTTAARLVERFRRDIAPALDVDGEPWVRVRRDVDRPDGVLEAGSVVGFIDGAVYVAGLLEAGAVDLVTDPEDIPARCRPATTPTTTAADRRARRRRRRVGRRA